MGRKSRFTVGTRVGTVVLADKVSDYQKFVDSNGVLKQHQAVWRVVCDCGREHAVSAANLYKGRVPCVCAPKQGGNKTHGLSHTSEHKTWTKMNERVRNPNCKDYADYGGRGICIAPRWESFENFYADMGVKPSDKHSLDRIDVDGDYCPENCRWATPIEQANNKRCTIKVTVGGVQKTLRDLSEEFGISTTAIRKRLRKCDSLDYVLSQSRHFYRFISIDGVTRTVAEHCRVYGVPYNLVMNDIGRGGKDPCAAIMRRAEKLWGTIAASNPKSEVRNGQTQTEAEAEQQTPTPTEPC